jgi:[ribosomal protein S5]-alanine N-acetyltransferase
VNEILSVFPLLHTSRLELVEIRQEHLQDLFMIFSNSEVTRYYNIITLKEEPEAQKYLDHFANRFANQQGIRWGLSEKGKNGIIGTIGFNNFTPHHRANIGFDLLPAYWNKGYTTEALRAVLDFGFNNLEINRIEAEVMQNNTASEMVLLKTGFTKEGLLRDWMLFNNRHYDMTMFSLLQNDHAGRK